MSLIDIGALEPVLERSGWMLDYLETVLTGLGYYEPPVNLDHLTRLLRANAHHESAVYCKRNTVIVGYQPGDAEVLPRADLAALALDFIIYGNAYLRIARDRAGRITLLEHLHARVMRRHRDPGRYVQVLPDGRTLPYAPGEVIHVMEYAPESSIYGLPEYLGALNSLLLNEGATLFRRKYYVNGAHMGFILFTDSEDIDEADIKTLTEKVSIAKGVGNFRSMFVALRRTGAKMNLLPVGDFAKDDFEKVKMVSRDDIISAHRVPPQILAVLTDNKVPVTGDLDKIVNLYNSNVVRPIQNDLADQINRYLEPGQQIAFDPYVIPPTPAAAPGAVPTNP